MTQKEEAWIGLFLDVPILIIPSVVAVFIAYDKGLSFAPLLMFTGTVVWGGLLWLLPFIQRKFRKDQKKITFDERDDLILVRAVSFASTAFWWVFIVSCFLLWFIIGPKSSIPTITLPLMAFGGALFMKIACSVAILIQYGRGAKDGA